MYIPCSVLVCVYTVYDVGHVCIIMYHVVVCINDVRHVYIL